MAVEPRFLHIFMLNKFCLHQLGKCYSPIARKVRGNSQKKTQPPPYIRTRQQTPQPIVAKEVNRLTIRRASTTHTPTRQLFSRLPRRKGSSVAYIVATHRAAGFIFNAAARRRVRPRSVITLRSARAAHRCNECNLNASRSSPRRK